MAYGMAHSQQGCPHCGGNIRKKLCDDHPGIHTYILACETCYHEYGEEWVEYHHQNAPGAPEARVAPVSRAMIALYAVPQPQKP